MQNPGLPIQKLQDIQRAMELLSCQGPAKNIDEAAKHKYQFWDTQPVPKLSTYSKSIFLFNIFIYFIWIVFNKMLIVCLNKAFIEKRHLFVNILNV